MGSIIHYGMWQSDSLIDNADTKDDESNESSLGCFLKNKIRIHCKNILRWEGCVVGIRVSWQPIRIFTTQCNTNKINGVTTIFLLLVLATFPWISKRSFAIRADKKLTNQTHTD